GVRLVGVFTRESPSVPELAAAADMASGSGRSFAHKYNSAGIKGGQLRNSVGAISLEKNNFRMLGRLRLNKRERHLHAILGLCLQIFHLKLRRIVARLGPKFLIDELVTRWLVAEDRWGYGPALQGQHKPRRARIGKNCG